MHVDDDGDPSVGSSPVPFEVLNRIGSSPDPFDDGDPTADPSSEAGESRGGVPCSAPVSQVPRGRAGGLRLRDRHGSVAYDDEQLSLGTAGVPSQAPDDDNAQPSYVADEEWRGPRLRARKRRKPEARSLDPADEEWLARNRREADARESFKRTVTRAVVDAISSDIRAAKQSLKTGGANAKAKAALEADLSRLQDLRQAHREQKPTQLPFEGVDERMARDVEARGGAVRKAYKHMRKRRQAERQ